MPQTMYEPVILLPSAARTSSDVGDTVELPVADNSGSALLKRGIHFVLNLTDAQTDTQDTLDVSIQTQLDGTNWIDVVHFTQILGDGANALTYHAKITADGAQAIFEDGSALAESAVRNILGRQWRAQWTIVDSNDGDQTFTFEVKAIPF